ncbi:MAG: NAD(+) synthase [Lachnospiraceae bacterium]|jgi:NAD+ synthase (glutamine-hydrolysing)|nr:NAD(+) synthase [Lachnospiraceae bacterium]
MKDGFVKVAAATPELVVADPKYNCEKMMEIVREAAQQEVQVLVLPELAVTGYTCGDLFLQESLLAAAEKELIKLAQAVGSMLVIVGVPVRYKNKLYNCAAVLNQGHVIGMVPKRSLPNYSEFYERRHFEPGFYEPQRLMLGDQEIWMGMQLLFACGQMKELVVAAEICEDLWVASPPSNQHALAGATLVVNPSASDEIIGKEGYRRQLVSAQSGRLYCGYIYADAGEGESTTDMVYAGHNLIAENGSILVESSLFSHGMIVTELDMQRIAYERRKSTTYPAVQDEGYRTIPFELCPRRTRLTRPVEANPFVPADRSDRMQRCESILAMQISGLRKRVEHAHAKSLVIGISGGLDSTLALLVAAGAMDRLGRSRTDIIGVTMPCFGTTKRTKSNAELLCQRMGITLRCVDIAAAVQRHFEDIGHDPAVLDVTYENCQARERTQVLMDIANQTGGLVVGTGDLSELALGWATYNGDHMSMYGVNASIPKTLVRHIISAFAEHAEDPQMKAVLRDILDTPVSPELLPAKNGEIAQKTEEIVGPYELHDFILYYVLRFGFAPAKIDRLAQRAFEGIYEKAVIRKWLRGFYYRFFQQQFKRSCLPDGPKVGSVTLSPRGDWRMPSDASAAVWMAEIETLQ